jgi:hypothetical protein
MTIELIDLVLRFSSAGILLLFALLLLRDHGRDIRAWVGIAIIVCCAAFLITSSNAFYREGLIDTALRQIAALTPAMLWIATYGRIRLPRDWYVAGAIFAYLILGLSRTVVAPEGGIASVLAIAHGLLAVGMLADIGIRAVVRRAERGSMRTQFAFVSVAFGAVVAYVDPIAHGFDLPLMTELLASTATFSFSLSVAFSALALPQERTAFDGFAEAFLMRTDEADSFEVGEATGRRRTG